MTTSSISCTSGSAPPRRHRRRAATTLAAIGAALLLGAGPALAHVSITTGAAAPGSYTAVGFRVPNESDTAATTSVEFQLPGESPFAFVSAGQAPGWTISTTETALPEPVSVGDFTVDRAVTTVTFTADGAGLAPHEFAVFNLLLGPIPDVGSLTFTAVQTYDDGEVVRWDQPTPASGEEPKYPAPVLTVGGASTDGVAADAASATATAAPSTDTTARVLGVAGIVVGLAGVGTGVILARGRQRTGPVEEGTG